MLQAALLSFTYIGMTFEAIAGFFNPQTFQASVSGASSVIGASYYASEAARAGALDYAGLVAVLSLSLGVINIFPIPPLDGGRSRWNFSNGFGAGLFRVGCPCRYRPPGRRCCSP